MNTNTRIAVITTLLAVGAFILGPVLWPSAIGEEPTATQLPFLIVISIIEALAFGYGIALAYIYIPRVRAVALSEQRARAMRALIAIVWLLASWWPHDNFHRWNGESLQGLIYIEYAFHVTLILAGIVVANYILREFRAEAQS